MIFHLTMDYIQSKYLYVTLFYIVPSTQGTTGSNLLKIQVNPWVVILTVKTELSVLCTQNHVL